MSKANRREGRHKQERTIGRNYEWRDRGCHQCSSFSTDPLWCSYKNKKVLWYNACRAFSQRGEPPSKLSPKVPYSSSEVKLILASLTKNQYYPAEFLNVGLATSASAENMQIYDWKSSTYPIFTQRKSLNLLPY